MCDAIIHHEPTLASLFTIYHRVIQIYNSWELKIATFWFGAAEIVDHINNYSIFLSPGDLILDSISKRLLDRLQNLLFLGIWQAEFVNFLKQHLALCITFLILLLILIIIVLIFLPNHRWRPTPSITQHIIVKCLLWANRPFWSLGFVGLFGKQSHRSLTLVALILATSIIGNYCTWLLIIL